MELEETEIGGKKRKQRGIDWNKNAVLVLIDIVRDNKGFWDPRSSMYSNRIYRQKVLETIRDELESECGVKVTENQIATKWQSLKAYFSSCNQKYGKSTRSGVNSEEVEDLTLAPGWEFYDKLLFLREKMATTPSVNSFNMQDIEVLDSVSNSQNDRESPSVGTSSCPLPELPTSSFQGHVPVTHISLAEHKRIRQLISDRSLYGTSPCSDVSLDSVDMEQSSLQSSPLQYFRPIPTTFESPSSLSTPSQSPSFSPSLQQTAGPPSTPFQSPGPSSTPSQSPSFSPSLQQTPGPSSTRHQPATNVIPNKNQPHTHTRKKTNADSSNNDEVFSQLSSRLLDRLNAKDASKPKYFNFGQHVAQVLDQLDEEHADDVIQLINTILYEAKKKKSQNKS